jgi:glycine/D-amino acid oxidase-like deaminating enzyme
MKAIKPSNRRNFLLAAGLGGAGVAAAVVTARKVAPQAADAAAPVAEASGYRASEHVMKYYKTTEV